MFVEKVRFRESPAVVAFPIVEVDVPKTLRPDPKLRHFLMPFLNEIVGHLLGLCDGFFVVEICGFKFEKKCFNLFRHIRGHFADHRQKLTRFFETEYLFVIVRNRNDFCI